MEERAERIGSSGRRGGDIGDPIGGRLSVSR